VVRKSYNSLFYTLSRKARKAREQLGSPHKAGQPCG
jgi:hypothetical protein